MDSRQKSQSSIHREPSLRFGKLELRIQTCRTVRTRKMTRRNPQTQTTPDKGIRGQAGLGAKHTLFDFDDGVEAAEGV
jgi:hypothetical protein